ncbi:MAG: TraB/GumN family protein [Candidatus Micrarchaeia archaeon]
MEGKEEIARTNIILVPVAHVSKKSARLVEDTIRSRNPGLVGLELCRERLEALSRSGKRSMDLRTAISHPTSAVLFAAQQLIGRWWQVTPGEEMVRALEAAAELQKQVALLDRPIRGIARDIERIPLKEKIGMVFSPGPKLFGKKKISLSEMMKPENLDRLLETFERDFPVSYKVFVESRNRHIFGKLLLCNVNEVVAVVGAAHVPGLCRLAEQSGENINIEIVE